MIEPTLTSSDSEAGLFRELVALVSRGRQLELGLDAILARSDVSRGEEHEQLEQAAHRIKASVLRPLVAAVTQSANDSLPISVSPNEGPSEASQAQHEAALFVLDEVLWLLAIDVTSLRVRYAKPTELQEAAAALQELALQFSAEGYARETKAAELRKIEADLPLEIQVQANGPYLVTNAQELVSWLGERVSTRPQMALCRCGGSSRKPFCDGTHAEIHFTDAKDVKRVTDRRDTYDGQQLAVLDNRGTCAHAGFCTDRVPSVFHLGKEPFVAPSGARMDEIVRAVRACPSGALSYSIDGHEASAPVRGAAIEVSKDGPYRITGSIPLLDASGQAQSRNEGATSEHYSLCRCGHSQNKPFCSGMHWNVKFSDPRLLSDEPTLFQWAGGLPALTRMTRLFYGKYVPEDPLIGPLFANMSPDHPERVASWLSEVFGGPKFYSDQYGGYARMVSQHQGKGLTEAQRARWVSLLSRSADDAGMPADPEFRAAFVSYLEWGSRLALENSQPGAKPPPQMPMPRWWWACDAKPGSRISALASTPETSSVQAPSKDEPVSFEKHIRSLFRESDRTTMIFAFDLWSREDVIAHADAILRRVEAGTMPCDGAWPKEKVETFRRWVRSGMS